MSKRVAFIALAILAVAFGMAGHRMQAGFLSDVWSQLFWLCVTTLTTAFVLESILHRAAQRRQRANDAFAFRSFAATMMTALLETVALKQEDDRLYAAALSGDKQFAQGTAETASAIEHAAHFEPEVYNKYYLDVASGLRTLSTQYIRLYSTSRKDMLTQYRELISLASQWRFRTELSQETRRYAGTLKEDNPERLRLDSAFSAQLASAKELVATTGKVVARLAAQVATGKSFYE